MTSITQQIPNYVGGISQQPDELKVPGQVRTAKNVLPDVTHGLLKRPGGRLIGSALSAYTTDSKWFHYYRDENEQYIGQIQLSTGEIKMWKCDTGAACTVNYESGQTTALKNYLKQTNSGGTITDSELQTLTLNDYTYITNRNKTTAMLTGTNQKAPVRPPEAYIELKKVAYASQYAVNLFDDTTTEEVYTATRIDVDREIDSSNACASNGGFPSSGALPGSTGSSRCNVDGTDFDHDDDMNPNVGTKIFSVDHNTAGNAADANNTAHNYTVTPNGGTASDRKNLYFRIATTGQSVPQGNGGSDGPEYISRYTTTHDLLYGGEGWRTGDIFYVWLKNAKYKITIAAHSVSKVQANRGLIRPEPTSFDTKTVVTAESIIGAIRTEIDNDAGANFDTVQQIGNGLYITRSSGTFNISSPVGELLNVLTSSVDDVGDLPKQCKHGYVIKVSNSEAEEDDYYVKFFGNNDRDGDGVWEECPKPGTEIAYDPATMPIQLIREANGTFTVKQITWENALAGDTAANGGTNPRGSFVDKTINKMLFFRNRLVLLSDENVIMSQPGEFFNFWSKSAITHTATDMIDLSCSSEYPAIVYDGLQVNAGLVLFTKNQQFMLTTDSDVLSPLTAKINSISNYNYNYTTNPFSLGTTVGFLDNAGANSRFFEMTSVLREGEPVVVEQTRPVPQLLPKDLTLVADSRENNTILFGTKNQDTVYGYRYFNTTNQRVQASWFKWKLTGTVQYHCMLDDAYYAVVRSDNKDVIQRFDITLDDTTSSITADDITYRIHFDNYSTLASSSLTYDAATDLTTFTLPSGYHSTNQLAAYYQTDDNALGSYSPATLVSGTTYSLPGDFSGGCYLGYLFDMEVKLPSIYFQTQISDNNFRSDVHSSLIVHRLKLSLGHTGTYTTTLHRKGKSDYTQILEAVNTDLYTANTLAFKDIKFQTIPVYDRNSNVTVTIKSSNPSPATLNSLTWEGDYSPKFYKRV